MQSQVILRAAPSGSGAGKGKETPRGFGSLIRWKEKMIVCVAVVGHQNNPLYVQSFTEADDALKLHHIVHCSLDVVDERDLDVRDADVRNFFRRFHAAYVDAVSNPFHVPGKKITSKTFAERVSDIVKSFGSSSNG